MADDPKKDDEKRDEVLKRMLGTKPQGKEAGRDKRRDQPVAPDGSSDSEGVPGGYSARYRQRSS